jgi:hypothetical protein
MWRAHNGVPLGGVDEEEEGPWSTHLKQFFGSGSLLGIELETPAHEVLEVPSPLSGILEGLRIALRSRREHRLRRSNMLISPLLGSQGKGHSQSSVAAALCVARDGALVP